MLLIHCDRNITDDTAFTIRIKTSIGVLGICAARRFTAFWRNEELYLKREWVSKDLCISIVSQVRINCRRA